MKKFTTTCLLFLCAIIWGFSFVAQTKSIDSGMGAMTYTGFRFIIGTISMLPVLLIFGRDKNKASQSNPKNNKKVLILGGISAGIALCSASFVQQFGIEVGVKSNTPNITGVAGFITGIYIIIIPIIRLVFGKRTRINTAIGAVLAVTGLYFLCVTDGIGSISKAHLLLLGCAFLFALHIIIVDKVAYSVNAIQFSVVQFVTAAILGTALAFITEKPTFEQLRLGIVPLLYSGILSSGIAYTLQTIAQKNSDPTFAGIVFSTESVFSAIGGALLLDEIMTGRGYLGCVIIFAGIIISQIEIKKVSKHFVSNKKIQMQKSHSSPDKSTD